jgi:hypothetical protein
MWTNIQFWKDASWRAFRTFCQSLAGLLTVQNVSSNLNAPWWTLIYAAGVAGLISFLQSVDRERAVAAAPSPDPAVAQPAVALPADVEVVTTCADAPLR